MESGASTRPSLRHPFQARAVHPPPAALLLGVALAALACAQSVAGLALRGLYADGAFYAAALWNQQGFAVIEPARWTAQALMQAPVVLAMRLGATSPLDIATALSLSTNLMPLVLTGASLAVLPAQARAWGLFAVVVFLAFSMSAAVASIADGATAAAYLWLLCLLILFAPPTSWAKGSILLLALGAVRLHEAMSFLGPLLVVAAATRARAAERGAHRLVLITASCLITIGTLLALRDLLHPRLVANRSAFISDGLGLRWLWAAGQPNVMAVIGLLGLAGLPVAWAKGPARAALWLGLCLGFLALTLLAVLRPMTAASSFAARGNACLASLPAMALLLLARRRGWPSPDRRALTSLAALLCLSVSLADLAATWQWQRYRDAMQTVLSEHRGIIGWQAALDGLRPAGRLALTGFAWPWTAPLMSLWLAPGGGIRSVIANPPGFAWEPFDPQALAALLRRNPPADQAAALGAVSGR